MLTPGRAIRWGLTAMTLAATATVLVSCTNGRTAYERRLQTTDQPSLHAVHHDHLQKIMAELNRRTFEDMPQEIDAERRKEENLSEVSRAAGRIAATAMDIPDVLNEVLLSDEHKDTFRKMAAQLRQQALELEQTARTGNLHAATEARDRMLATCARCHDAFRVLPKVQPET